VASGRVLHPPAARASDPCLHLAPPSRTGPLMGGSPACRTWSTSSPARAWRSGSTAGSNRRTPSTPSRTRSSSGGGPHQARQRPRVRGPGRAGPDRSRGAETADIEPGAPRENGTCESLNSKLRDEFWDGETFSSLEAQILIESWRRPCTTKRPPSSLGSRPPAPEVTPWPAPPRRPRPP
jgi:putative transposase